MGQPRGPFESIPKLTALSQDLPIGQRAAIRIMLYTEARGRW